MIKIDYEKCCWKGGKCVSCDCGGDSCGGCVEACPVQAIYRRDLVQVNPGRCIDCGACVSACKQGAITMV